MTKTLGLYEAKTRFSALVEEAAAGEEIVITKNGKAKARLVPIAPEKPKRVVKFGGLGEVKGLLPDGRIPPLDDDIIAVMLGEDPNDPLFADEKEKK